MERFWGYGGRTVTLKKKTGFEEIRPLIFNLPEETLQKLRLESEKGISQTTKITSADILQGIDISRFSEEDLQKISKTLADLEEFNKPQTFPDFCQKYLKVVNKKGKLVPFVLNKAQRILWSRIEKVVKNKKAIRFIILKARQLGISTFIAAFLFYRTIKRPFTNTLILADEMSGSRHLFGIYKTYYSNLPETVRPMQKYNTRQEYLFQNPEEKTFTASPGLRSRITIATAGKGLTIHTQTIHNLHLSEVAFYADPEKSITSTLQTVPDDWDTAIFFESTANGMGDYFHTKCLESMGGTSDYEFVFFPWTVDDDYKHSLDEISEKELLEDLGGPSGDYGDEIKLHSDGVTLGQLAWRRYTIKEKCNGSLDTFNEQYPYTERDAFLTAGRRYFDYSTVLAKYERKISKPIATGFVHRYIDPDDETKKKSLYKFLPLPRGELQIFVFPEPKEKYVVSADTAVGKEMTVGTDKDTDENFVVVRRRRDLKLVAQYHSKIDPDLLGDMLVDLAVYYNKAFIICEVNGPGIATLNIAKRRYGNFFMRQTLDERTLDPTQKIGWQTNDSTRSTLLVEYQKALRTALIPDMSQEILDQCFSFIVNKHGKPIAGTGARDDAVFADALIIQAIKVFSGTQSLESFRFNPKQNWNYNINLPKG